MKQVELNRLLEETVKAEKALLNSKGLEYTRGGDRLDNFKRNAKALGSTPLRMCLVFLQKHIDSIFNYAKHGDVLSEPIDSRIHDARNYLLLALAIIEEERTDEPARPMGARKKK